MGRLFKLQRKRNKTKNTNKPYIKGSPLGGIRGRRLMVCRGFFSIFFPWEGPLEIFSPQRGPLKFYPRRMALNFFPWKRASNFFCLEESLQFFFPEMPLFGGGPLNLCFINFLRPRAPDHSLSSPKHTGRIICWAITQWVSVRELSFFTGRGGHLSVIAGRQFFLVPPLACVKKFWSAPRHAQKNSGPPLGLRKKILVPPLVKEHPLT